MLPLLLPLLLHLLLMLLRVLWLLLQLLLLYRPQPLLRLLHSRMNASRLVTPRMRVDGRRDKSSRSRSRFDPPTGGNGQPSVVDRLRVQCAHHYP